MAAVTLVRALVAAGIASPIAASAGHDEVARWQPIVAEAAARFGLPAVWIERVIRAESAGRTMLGGKPIRSKAGAIGLMQVMPETWAAMRVRYRLGANPDDPHDNVFAGSAFLRLMYDRFGYPGMFAAYNAGPSRYAAYLEGRARLPIETIGYLAEVTDGRSAGVVTATTAPRDLLFALRRDLATPTRVEASGAPDKGLFAVRKDLP